MDYRNAKIYFDGSHYIAIPQGAFPSGRARKKTTAKQQPTTPKERFEQAYKDNYNKPKRERIKAIKEALNDDFSDEEELTKYVKENMERKQTNAIKRKVRLMRKLRLQDWNYFCTFTYDDSLHNEETFRKKLSNTLKHLVYRNDWKYVGVWERSTDKQRLHFHGIFCIPKMVGTIEEVKDYSTKNHRRQITYQNSHFLKHFGRNDFRIIGDERDITQAVKYISKYLEKSGEKLVYGGKLPTYFLSDVLEEDIACPYGIDGRKALLFDDFTCFFEGAIIGQVSKETISKLPKCN